MTFQEAIKTCFNKYADFNGRAAPPEFWWFVLFVVLVSAALSVIHPMLTMLFNLAVLVPSISVGARRLHDTGRSGWWQLVGLIPVIGMIVLIVFMVQSGKPGGTAPSEPGAQP